MAKPEWSQAIPNACRGQLSISQVGQNLRTGNYAFLPGLYAHFFPIFFAHTTCFPLGPSLYSELGISSLQCWGMTKDLDPRKYDTTSFIWHHARGHRKTSPRTTWRWALRCPPTYGELDSVWKPPWFNREKCWQHPFLVYTLPWVVAACAGSHWNRAAFVPKSLQILECKSLADCSWGGPLCNCICCNK